MSIPAAPEGYATINPFIITLNSEELTRFIVEVFEGGRTAGSPHGRRGRSAPPG